MFHQYKAPGVSSSDLISVAQLDTSRRSSRDVEYVQKGCAKKHIRDMNTFGMPVTPDEWDSGVAYTLLAKGILSFLRENSPMGYSASELYDMLSDIGRVHGFDGQTISHTDIVESLNGLVNDEQLESKELEGETSSETYYRATD